MTNHSRAIAPFERFLSTIQQATNESQKRQAFIVLAAQGFDDTEFATELALGSEFQVRFRQAGVIRRGAVDTFHGNLIVEFENDLTRTREHALDQLRGYVAGAWHNDASTARAYLAVASDGDRWDVYAPSLVDKHAPASAENTMLELLEAWPGPGIGASPESLMFFLNRLFFRKTLLAPTANNFARDFGLTSPAYAAAKRTLLQKLDELRTNRRLEVLRSAWVSSLQVAYGSVETDDQLFAKHTYLAVLARLLVWASIEHKDWEPKRLGEVLEGHYFLARNIANLVEDDYFHWYQIKSATDAGGIWLALAQHLAGYSLTSIREDVLKPLYEQLVDPATRHYLGEYYTPDWLAARVVVSMFDRWDWSAGAPSVLDPACGSGTFLRAAIDEMKQRLTMPETKLASTVVDSVVGFDVHPLAVLIARATYVLALGPLVRRFPRPVTIPVYLTNSLQVPDLDPNRGIFGDFIFLDVDGIKYRLPTDLVQRGHEFDAVIDDVVAVARNFAGTIIDPRRVETSIRRRIGDRLSDVAAEDTMEVLGALTTHLARLIKEDRDTVHAFMLKNHYRPAVLRWQFDIVVGNPPWLTLADVRAPSYRDLLLGLNNGYKVLPRAAGEQAHTEVAALFLPHVVKHFLKESARHHVSVAFVMPRALFNATHYRLIREGAHTAHFGVEEIWDLEQVTPLFNVPACVLFVSGSRVAAGAPKRGRVLSGRLPGGDVPWSLARQHLTERKTSFELARLGRRSAWKEGTKTADLAAAKLAPTYYAKRFRQGAILYPQTLLVVQPQGDVDIASGPIQVRNDPRAAVAAKLLATERFALTVDRDNLFATAAAEHILPYTLEPDLWTVVLPSVVGPEEVRFGSVDADALRDAGRVETAAWLERAEALWEGVRKQSETKPLWERLDHLGHLSGQAGRKRHLLLYTSAGNRTVAATVDTRRLRLPFVARDMTYWFSSSRPGEVHYLCAFLNSDTANQRISDFQTTGLFGKRHIHKRVLDLPIPPFDPGVPEHRQLALLGVRLASAAGQIRRTLVAKTTGRRRSELRKRLPSDLLEEVETHAGRLLGTR